MAQREGIPPRPISGRPGNAPGAAARAANPRTASAQPAPAEPDRVDSLLEERFSRANLGQTARQLAEHDRQRPTPLPTAGSVSGVLPLPAAGAGAAPAPGAGRGPRLRFQGAVPERVRQVLADWVPALLELADQHGLRLHAAALEVQVLTRDAYERQQGPLASGLRLPASSYRLNALFKTYTVNLVLPDQVQSTEEVLSVLRALLTRICGDIYLREEVFSLQSYREDETIAGEAVTAGMAEKLLLLGDLPISLPALDKAIADYASLIGLNVRRAPGQGRKAFFQDLAQRLEKEQLSYEYTALVDEVFAAYLADLRRDLPAAVQTLADSIDKLNAQTLFLPPEEHADYVKLKATRPDHFLRAAKLRLEFVLENLNAVIEEFSGLDAEHGTVSPLAEERVQGLAQRLEQEQLARPYLVPGARLGPELERARKGFPLEVHAILAAREAAQREQAALDPAGVPGAVNTPGSRDQSFKTLSHQLQNSLLQRAYQALLLLRQGLRRAERRESDAFRRSESYRALKGLVANFRFRLPLLHRLFVQVGIVLDLVESAPQAQEPGRAKRRFPLQAFARAWGNFAAHFLIAELLQQRAWKGFQPDRYWSGIDAGLAQQVAQSPGPAHLTYLMRRYQFVSGQSGLTPLVSLLRNPTGTLRFVVNEALAAPPAGQTGSQRLEQLDEWAAALLAAQRAAERNAIVVAPGAASA